MNKRLPPDIETKYAGTNWLIKYNGGPGNEYMIPNRIMVHQMPDSVYPDLFGGRRVDPWNSGDGLPLIIRPNKMQTFTMIDLTAKEIIGYWFVDERVEIVNEPWFDLADVLSLSPQCWSHALKNRYPGAPQSVFYPAI